MNAPRIEAALERWRSLLRAADHAPGVAGEGWDWYALLRLIQCAYPDRPRFGYSTALRKGTAAFEPVRLAQPVFFHHPSPTVAQIAATGPRETPPAAAATLATAAPARRGSAARDSAGPDAWIYAYHFGLFGPFGPLPLHLTEFAHRRALPPAHDSGLVAFCNSLVHRLACFFFRAWAEARKEVSLDRALSVPKTRDAPVLRTFYLDVHHHGECWWELFLATLIGCGLDPIRTQDRVPQQARLFFAGRLAQPTRSAEGLRAIIEGYFVVPARLIEFQARALPIHESARWQLGVDSGYGRVGYSAFLGSRVVNHENGIQIRLGPLSLPQLVAFLPDADGFGELHDWLRLYLGLESDPNPEVGMESAWDLRLVLRAAEVPRLHLDGLSRLGWTTWLHSTPPTTDVDDVLLRPRPASPRDVPASARHP